MALQAYLTRNPDGSIDFKTSADKLISDLKTFEIVSDTNNARIASAVSAIFDRWKCNQIPRPGIVQFTMSELQATPENYADLAKAVDEYLKANTGELGKALFGVSRGRGMFRWSDNKNRIEQ